MKAFLGSSIVEFLVVVPLISAVITHQVVLLSDPASRTRRWVRFLAWSIPPLTAIFATVVYLRFAVLPS